MCSITVSKTCDEKLSEIKRSGSGDHKRIEKNLFRFAGTASLEQSGPLDETSTHLSGFPPDLKQVRRKRMGSHRVFYTGYHTQCSYNAMYIKVNKRAGTEDELDPHFHDTLRSALADLNRRLLKKPKA